MKNSVESDTVDCLGMGIMPLDLLYSVKRLPLAGEKIDALDRTLQGGGPVPNALVGLSRLGLSTALIAVVGDDHMGRTLIAELQREGVDHSLVVSKKRPTAVAIGLIELGSGRRTIVLHRRVFIGSRDVRTSACPIPRVVHLDGRDLEATMKLARWARRVGAAVSFDIGSVRNDVTPVLPLVDHLVVADAFAFSYTGARRAAAAIRRLADICPGSIVVTEGLKGSTGLEREAGRTTGEMIRQPAFKVACVDATGAGDSFHAGYLYGLLKGLDMAGRLEFGAAVAALKCRRSGARAGAPTLRQVMRFLRDNPRTYA